MAMDIGDVMEQQQPNRGTSATISQMDILQTLIDISRIITTSHNLEETLENTVDLIAERMTVDVCSIYLYDDQQDNLVLMATHGLDKQAVRKVQMRASEGLIGYVIEKRAPVNEVDVMKHPRFKYFPSINEERLASFLGVPLIEHRKTLGVLAIQNQESRQFTQEETKLLLTIASQISGLISKALLVDLLQHATDGEQAPARPADSFQLSGVPIAPGLAHSKIVLYTRARLDEPDYRAERPPDEERASLRRALDESVSEILDLIQELTDKVSETDAAIFHAHLLFLEDRGFLNKVDAHIEAGASAAWAVSQVVRDYLKAFQSIDDPYLKERGADLEDVGFRVLHHLGAEREAGPAGDREGILVAELLTPSDTARLDPTKIKGIITTIGGHVSHAAILARSMRIPAVSGIEHLRTMFVEGEDVLVDGETGNVFVNPGDAVINVYQRYEESHAQFLSHLEDLRDVPCTTKDGQRITLRANVGLTQDLGDIGRYGAEGVGLFRTEVYYLMRNTRPTEDDLAGQYAKVMEAAAGQPVIFRTLDLGGDKFPSYLHFPKEENPFLGCRSIRYQLRRQTLLRDQLKAILRVAHMGQVKLLFPMISHLDELHHVKRIYNSCREELLERGGELPRLDIGMMFEVPSAVIMRDLFAGEVEFLSIGSNDLTQYVLAVDRNNPHVSHLYDPLDPAVLIMIQQLIACAAKFGKPIELCGEMASDPEGCPVLVGMGLRELSMNAPLIPLVKDRLSRYTLTEMERLADIAQHSTTAENVRRNIHLFLHD
ncbi:MAG: phosphoenolpyruvate--protein phosphotransferase [Candidatus Lambdaproteobacteria bacterium]|nr:phosphoenolpyruvate--protein phosphotransferase [Candidatus Lambdaproteobacteria bacterium]